MGIVKEDENVILSESSRDSLGCLRMEGASSGSNSTHFFQ